MLAPLIINMLMFCLVLLIVAWLVELTRGSFKTLCRREDEPLRFGSYRVETWSRNSQLAERVFH